MTRPQRRNDEIEAARARILSAAARVFAEKGFAEASVQEIAEAAGYSAPSLYTYFKNKKAVVLALLRSVIAEAEGLFDLEFPAGLTFAQRLELLIRHHNSWAECHRNAFLFCLQRGGELYLPKTEKSRFTEAYIQKLAQWLEQNAAPGDLDGITPQDAADMFWGMNHANFLRWTREGCTRSLNQSVARIITVFLGGIRSLSPEDISHG